MNRTVILAWLLAICTVLLTSAPGPSAAQDSYENHCDGAVLFECGGLALRYRSPSIAPPHFPDDPARADALTRTAIDGARAGCTGADYDLCFVLSSLSLRVDNPTAPYTDVARMRDYVAGTEAGCAAGIAAACYWRSVAFPPYKPEVFDIGVAFAIAAGTPAADAPTLIDRNKRTFAARAESAAAAQAGPLRQECTAGTPAACAQLGGLIKDYEALRLMPFEHITLLIDACTIDDPKSCRAAGNAVRRLAVTAPSRALEQPIQTQAINTLSDHCAAGRAAHCLVLSDLSKVDDRLDKNTLLGRACTLGAGAACLAAAKPLLFDYRDTNAPRTLDRAVTLLTRACDLDTALACHMIEHLSKG